MTAPSVSSVIDRFASEIERAEQCNEDIDAGGALRLVASAAREALECHSQDDAVRQVEAVKSRSGDVGVPSINMKGFAESADCRVVGRVQVYVRDVQGREVRLVLAQEGGDLSVEIVLVEFVA